MTTPEKEPLPWDILSECITVDGVQYLDERDGLYGAKVIRRVYVVPESQARDLWDGVRSALFAITTGKLVPTSEFYDSRECHKLIDLLRSVVEEKK